MGALCMAFVVALVSATSSSDETDAKTVATPATTVDQTTATVLPATTTTLSTSSPSTSPATSPSTSTVPDSTTSTTTTLPPPTTVRQNTGTFDGDAFDAVVAAATVDVGDIAVGAAVLRNGKVLHTTALGMENPFESRAATVDTRFRIASVSKVFTAVAIMQLVDEGSIELDEPFARQLGVDGPFTDPRIADITVRQLMSHLSGFSAAQGIFFRRGVETWHQAAQSALGEVLQADPGTAFQYSNTNFCLLGLLLEKVTGQPFEAVIRERVLQPIGISAHLAPTFDTERGDALHASSPGRNYMEALGPAGGWVASPLDIAKLACGTSRRIRSAAARPGGGRRDARPCVGARRSSSARQWLELWHGTDVVQRWLVGPHGHHRVDPRGGGRTGPTVSRWRSSSAARSPGTPTISCP